MSKQQRWLQLFTAVVLVLTTFAVVPQVTQAQTSEYRVDIAADDSNGVTPRTGKTTICSEAEAEDCTLRQAMEEAETDGTPSRITFLEDLIGQVINLDTVRPPLPELDTENNTIIDALIDPFDPFTPKIAINGGGSAQPGFVISTNNNTISGLSLYGFTCGFGNAIGAIVIQGAGATDNTIQRNYIGPDLSGTAPTTGFRNCSGVFIRNGSNNNQVFSNIIGGNQLGGAVIENASDNTVNGNLIGLQLNANQDLLPNGRAGVAILSNSGLMSINNIIGGTQIADRNVISGNGTSIATSDSGILLQGSGVMSNTLQGNYIGLRSSGAATRPNNGDGIRIESGAKNNSVSGTSGAPHVISGNLRTGIRIIGAGTTGNAITGGIYIGTATNGGLGAGSGFPNQLGGIAIDDGASNSTITGTPATRTLVSGNTSFGISIAGINSRNNKITGVYVGLVPNPAATSIALRLPNTGNGIQINAARNTEISGANYVSGNSGYGLRLTNVQSTTITGNFIGPKLNRSETFSNILGGILVESSAGTTRNTLIGSDASPNMISGNGGPGIAVTGIGTVSTTISGNLIGILKQPNNAKLTAPGGNLRIGISVSGGARETIIRGNTLVDSRDEPNVSGGGEAVVISGTGTNTTTVTLNRIGVVLDGTTEIGRSNRGGVWISGGPINTTVTSNTIKRNTGDAIQATDTTTTTIIGNNVSFNGGSAIRVGGVAERTTVRKNILDSNTGDGVTVEGAALRTDIISNTITRNAQVAVRVSDTAQRAKIFDNVISRNTEGGILLSGTTIGGGGSAIAPNHDIDPPILTTGSPLRLRINENGLLIGYVYTSTIKLEQSLAPSSACISCTIQLFGSDPERPAPDGQGFVKIADDVVVADPTGRFATQILGFSQNRPRQVLLTATDGFGNTSQYAVFNVSAGLTLTPVNPVPAQQTAVPGQTVTYTHRLENTGSLDLTDLRLTSLSVNGLNWTTTISPPTLLIPLALPAGQNQLVTVTLTLPTGSATNVRAGLQDITKLIAASTQITQAQASTLMTTTVLAQGIINITPKNQVGNGAPGSQVAYIHTITNSGNVTATVSLVAQTIDPAQGTLWSTTLSASTIEVPPGLTRDFTVRVTVPAGAQEKINGVPVQATTTITGTVADFPTQTKVVSDVTGVTLVPRAIMLRDESTFGAAGQTVRIRHRVENISNGTATFKLRGNSSGGSIFKFISDTPGVTLTNDFFTLSNRSDPNTGETNVFNFIIEIKLNNRLLPGAVDVIDISLLESNGSVIGGANVQDRVTITAGQVQPRLWLPMIFKQQPPQ